MSNLYELKAAYQHEAALLADLDLDPQTLADTLESLSGDLETKATNTIFVARNLRATADAIKQAEAAMSARRKAMEARADALELRVFNTMLETGIQKIESPYFALKIANNPASVDVFDSLQVPPDYMREVPATYAPDKALIKKALIDGYNVPGARLVQGQRLAIK
jgi:hypothetical protein